MIQPMHDRVVVRRADQLEKTKTGLYVPQDKDKKPNRGTVVAVGTGRRLSGGGLAPLTVQKGDSVLFGKFAGTDVQIEGEDLLVLREDEILAIVEEN